MLDAFFWMLNKQNQALFEDVESWIKHIYSSINNLYINPSQNFQCKCNHTQNSQNSTIKQIPRFGGVVIADSFKYICNDENNESIPYNVMVDDPVFVALVFFVWLQTRA